MMNLSLIQIGYIWDRNLKWYTSQHIWFYFLYIFPFNFPCRAGLEILKLDYLLLPVVGLIKLFEAFNYKYTWYFILCNFNLFLPGNVVSTLYLAFAIWQIQSARQRWGQQPLLKNIHNDRKFKPSDNEYYFFSFNNIYFFICPGIDLGSKYRFKNSRPYHARELSFPICLYYYIYINKVLGKLS